MESTRSSRSSLTSLSLLVLLYACFCHVDSQNACDGPATIVINFPELDPPATPPSNAIYTQPVLTSGIEPDEVTITNDTKNAPDQKYPFDSLFEANWNFAQNAYVVSMVKPIDRDGTEANVEDDINILQYQLGCRASGSPIQYKVLKIVIKDTNDNAPVFENAPYVVDVNELTPVGLTVYRLISAFDIDQGPNRQIEYSLTDSPGAKFKGVDFFSLPSRAEGILAVNKTLDFESMYALVNDVASDVFFNITITATDGGTSPMSSSTFIIIRITDGDDLGPTFLYPSCIPSEETFGKPCIRAKYASSIDSKSNSFTTLKLEPIPSDAQNPEVLMIMEDRDTLNSSITCRIDETRPKGYKDYFQTVVSNSGGKQYVCSINHLANKPIDRSGVPELELIIEAVEQSDHKRVDYATVVVTVAAVDLNAPTITANSPVGYIYENSLLNTRVSANAAITNVLQLIFTDPDVTASDPTPQFDISVTPASSPFRVSQNGYIELSTLPLNYESQASYPIKVTITEQSTLKRTATSDITIQVLDINDNSPQFSTPTSYSKQTPEGNYTSSRFLLTLDRVPGIFDHGRCTPITMNPINPLYITMSGLLSPSYL